MFALFALFVANAAFAQELPVPFEPPTFQLDDLKLDLSDTPKEYKVPGEVLRQRGRTTTYVGAGIVTASIPAALGVAGVLSLNCQQECMSAPLFGAATFVGLATIGGVVTVAGVTTSAIGRQREKRTIELGLGGVVGRF